MTKSRQQLLLDSLSGKRGSGPCTCHGLTDPRIANRVPSDQHHPTCARRHAELARQLLAELDTLGPFSLTKSSRYRGANGRFASFDIVQAWTVRETVKMVTRLANEAPVQRLPPHGLYEAHVAMKDDAPVRTAPTLAKQAHNARVALWWSEDEGQAQHDHTQATME